MNRKMIEILRNASGLKYTICAFVTVLISGCVTPASESFILKTDLPANFRLQIDAYYTPATGETCTMPPRTPEYIPGQKRFKSEMQEADHSVEFSIPLTDSARGCPLVLKSVGLYLQGKWGVADRAKSNDSAGISFVDSLAMEPSLKNKFYNGECQWLFRTVGSERHIIKILRCRAIDEKGQVLKQMAGGVLTRDQLAGKTVTWTFKVAKEEEPYMGDTWIKFENGWKRCMGKGLDDRYGFCRGNSKDFKPFKMPDGRDCTIYPNCTE